MFGKVTANRKNKMEEEEEKIQGNKKKSNYFLYFQESTRAQHKTTYIQTECARLDSIKTKLEKERKRLK